MSTAQSGCDCASVRPMVPPKDGSGIGSTVRSGLNLAAAVASASFSAPRVRVDRATIPVSPSLASARRWGRRREPLTARA